MKFGIQTGTVDWQQLRDRAQAAEGLGFHAIMLPDHIISEGPGRQVVPHDAYDPVVAAAIIAESTKRLRVGHLVLCNLFRHPVFTAQAVMTLDHLSGGRAFLGLGTGWTETEFRMTGIAFPEIDVRLRMLDEALTCIRGLWTGEPTTFAGEFYQLRDAVLKPPPVQKPHPPVLLGGGGKGLLRIAARHADVVNIVADVGRVGYIKLENVRKFTDESFRTKVAFLRQEATRNGRAAQAIKMSHVVFQTTLTDSPAATQQMAESLAGMLGMTPEGALRCPTFLIGTAEECVAEIKRREREWELSEIVFSFNDEAVMQRIGREVLPHL
jgi:probable F420-dependent oxidoreductase